MAEVIVFSEKPQPKYFDRESKYTREEIEMKEKGSTTVYVGKLNQSPPTTESQIYSTFSQCGPIKRIVMGVRKETYEPAGFCFIEFCTRDAAIAAIKWMNETIFDKRKITVNIDYGFEEGRQYLRNKPSGNRRNSIGNRRGYGYGDRRRRPPPQYQGQPPQRGNGYND